MIHDTNFVSLFSYDTLFFFRIYVFAVIVLESNNIAFVNAYAWHVYRLRLAVSLTNALYFYFFFFKLNLDLDANYSRLLSLLAAHSGRHSIQN